MASDVPLDYAVFQLSPKRSHCELFVSYDGATEKLASGLVKPFVTHLKVAEEQVALAVKSIKLEVEKYKNAETWFTKGTLERFVRFVSTPEVLEMVNTFDAEMSQLEAARRIYSQGVGEHQSSASGGDGTGATAASDATKKELLRAIDVRLGAVKQDLMTACSRAFAAGFCPDSVSELQLFADRFGAPRLSEACSKFMDLSRRRPELFTKSTSDDGGNQSKSATCQPPTKPTFPLRCFSREPSPADDGEERENPKDKNLGPTTTTSSTTESDPPSTQSSSQAPQPQLTRRLSVQERISLFESKQKENSPSTPTPSASSAGVKPELRRLSSDVAASSDKAVLRRWSGACDMSLDGSGERKESDANATTPTPASSLSSSFPAFPPKSKGLSDLKADEGDKDKECKLPVRAKFGAHLAVFSGSGSGPGVGLEEPSWQSSDNVGLKDQATGVGGAGSKAASFGKGEDSGSEKRSGPVQNQFRSCPGKTEQIGFAEQDVSEEKAKGLPGGESKPQQDIGKNIGVSASRLEGRSDGQQGEIEAKSNFRVAQKKTVEVVSAASDVQFQSVIQNKGGEVDSTPEPRWRSFGEQAEKVVRTDAVENQAESFVPQMENSGSSRCRFQGHDPASEQVKKRAGKREEGGSRSGKTAIETQETFPSSSNPTMDQVPRVRQSKGNQGLNDELKMKANELEKLFAEHKQSNSARRARPAEMLKELDGSSVSGKAGLDAASAQLTNIHMKMEAEPASGSNSMERFSTPLTKAVDIRNYDVTPMQNIYTPSFSDDSRGKFYHKYMQKRDAKLRDDWSSRRTEKEAKMKALQDSLQKSKAELKAKLAGSAEKRNSVTDAHRRAEKLRSFSARSATKRGQPIDSFMSDGDDDQAESFGKKPSETYVGDISRNAQSKKALPNKNTTASTPRISAAPVPRSSGKASNSAAGRRRLNSDNPLAQSVPNFSDLRKENTKPLSSGSKPLRSQARNHARKKSVSEDLPFVNEDKPRRSQSLRKSTGNAVGLNDSGSSDNDKEENEGPKSVPRKGNGMGRVAGSGSGRSKASMMVESVGNGHAFHDASSETEEVIDIVKEDDNFENVIRRGESADPDNGKGRLSQDSDKSANSGYENSDAFRFSQAGPASATEFPTSMTSLFGLMGSLQDSPGESPGFWNSRANNPFSFPHEISDIDAADSPIGSPASWNFQTLAQSEVEAARMRKKWGAAQKPIVGTESSHSLSRKDVTRGLKRFLKFGRKNRASESLADWISATTSEGDDDTEDGRDTAYRSSEDLRKSRMGFSHSHHSEDGSAESYMFNERAPKSFFSLSNFRSKGSDSKLR
ncbi:hypothetical protein Cgig2_025199 [Carnegiea gigantea]|uniref:COP1-interacting protein 7 n=1 Tax=Carnegiea gigantea TaxID=171969 RepID=A0A9Q1QQ59_9CARY|nr:hypothetical protein Cgig2_025199 [Carnegiea gigantea]